MCLAKKKIYQESVSKLKFISFIDTKLIYWDNWKLLKRLKTCKSVVNVCEWNHSSNYISDTDIKTSWILSIQ